MSAQPKRPVGTWLAIAIGVVVIATVAAAIATMGTPWQQRRVRLDEARVGDLIRVRDAVNCYFRKHDKLPANVAAALCENSDARVADLETHRPYEYLPTGNNTYRLCAVFDIDTRTLRGRIPLDHAKAWDHPAGRYCFEQHASKHDDEELVPMTKDMITR
jgi:hypothetical protein